VKKLALSYSGLVHPVNAKISKAVWLMPVFYRRKLIEYGLSEVVPVPRFPIAKAGDEPAQA
jgi:hypothetical protein